FREPLHRPQSGRDLQVLSPQALLQTAGHLPAEYYPRRGPDRLDAKDEDSSLGRGNAFHEELLWHYSRRGLWLAEECPALVGDSRVYRRSIAYPEPHVRAGGRNRRDGREWSDPGNTQEQRNNCGWTFTGSCGCDLRARHGNRPQ